MKNFLLNILPINDREDMPKIVYIAKKMLAFLLCLYGAGIVCEGIVIGAMLLLGKDPLKGDMFSDTVMEMIMYYGYAAVVGIILLYWKLIEKKSLAELGFTGKFGGYFLGCGLAAVILGASVTAVILTGGLRFNGIFSSVNVPVILLYFGGFIFQGIYEEVLCRGILLQTLRRRLSLPWTVVLCNLPFIVLHISSMKEGGIYSLLGIANLAAVSVVFTLLTIRTGSIWASCGLHTFWNFALYNVFGLNLSGSESKVAAVFSVTSPESSILNGGAYGIEASVITLAILSLCIAALLTAGRKDNGISSKFAAAV